MTSEYRIEIDTISKDEWTELLLQFDDATIYQTWSYGATRWNRKNLSHLIVKINEEVIGISQVAIKKLPFVGAGIAYIPWGPLWQKKKEERNYENLRATIKALKEEYVSHRGLFLRIMPNIIEDRSNDTDKALSILEDAGFRQNSSLLPYRTFIVDLSPSLSDIRKKLDQKWRNQLNRSEKNELSFIEGDSDELYKIFLSLQGEMRGRKKYDPGVDYDEFREIQKDLSDPVKMKIIVCEYQGAPVTATIVSDIGDTGIYLFGATGDKGLKLKGAYLSQWLMIQWLKEKGCRWYDLGGIDPERNPGVYHFKAGLSGKEVYHIGQFEMCKSILSNMSIRMGDVLRGVLNKK